jgi:type VI secretion system secreted protein Hcp
MPISLPEMKVGAAGGDAASDIFLSVTTKRAGKLKGESTTAGHQGETGLFSWGWGVSASTAIGSTAATARRVYKHLVFTKGIDATSTGLLSALVTNDEVKEAKLTMRKAGGDALDYFTMTLSEARVVALDIEISSDGLPLERVAIAFNKVEVEYQQQQGGGLGSGAFVFSDEVMPGS